MERLTRAAYVEARARVAPQLHRTPLLSFRSLGKPLGVDLFLKCENLQKTGSFKVRGALNSVSELKPEERGRGVITISAGNHAQAVAWAAAKAGVAATVVMPEEASQTKVEATRGYGARVVLHGTAADAFREAHRIAEAEGSIFLHPFDAEPVIAGHGSTALELEEDLAGPATVIVPVGGGGQISGIAGAFATKDRSAPGAPPGAPPTARPLTRGHKVFGVEPEGAPAMRKSLDAGEAITLDRTDTIADGLAPPMAGQLTYVYVRECVEDMVTVSDDDILDAMALLMTRAKLMVEPSGAAGVAALMTGKIPLTPGSTVVAVLSGGNVDPDLIRRALERDSPWP